jgi:hypothetical protein
MGITRGALDNSEVTLTWDGSDFTTDISYTVEPGMSVLTLRAAGPLGVSEVFWNTSEAFTEQIGVSDG